MTDDLNRILANIHHELKEKNIEFLMTAKTENDIASVGNCDKGLNAFLVTLQIHSLANEFNVSIDRMLTIIAALIDGLQNEVEISEHF